MKKKIFFLFWYVRNRNIISSSKVLVLEIPRVWIYIKKIFLFSNLSGPGFIIPLTGSIIINLFSCAVVSHRGWCRREPWAYAQPAAGLRPRRGAVPHPTVLSGACLHAYVFIHACLHSAPALLPGWTAREMSGTWPDSGPSRAIWGPACHQSQGKSIILLLCS